MPEGPATPGLRGRAVAVIGLAALAVVCGACTAPVAPPGPLRAPDFRPQQIRQPALSVLVSVPPEQFSDREREAMPAEYESALLEALNARAVLARDVQVSVDRARAADRRTALDRAREVGADHAVVIGVQVSRGERILCRQGRRPLHGTVTVWQQEVEVLRAGDGARRLALEGAPLEAVDLEVDCDNPSGARRRSPTETIAAAVDVILSRILGP
jgi:hypothetical protein